MTGEYLTTVSYDSSDRDGSAVICGRHTRDGKISIVVGYTDEQADELQKLVTEQGYLNAYEDKVLNKFGEYMKKHHFDISEYIDWYKKEKNNI